MKKIYHSNQFVNYKYAKGKTDIYARMFHEYYEIYLLLHGDVEFVNNHTRQTIKPLQLILIPPGEYHQFIVTNDIDNYERCVINIYPEFFDKDILKAVFNDKSLIQLPQSHRITESFTYLNEAYTKVNKDDFSYILSAVVTDIIFLIKYNTQKNELSAEKLRPISVALINYIDTHYTEALNLNLLSQKFNFSVSSLCHIFKEDFGISIKKYIIQKRMNASNFDLHNGLSPEEVCAKYGFQNYSTFYRAYKAQFGTAPSKITYHNL